MRGDTVILCRNDLQADFSLAYVRAVAHAAGFFISEANRSLDSDGVDLEMFARGRVGQVRSPRVSLQVKSSKHGPRDGVLAYDLKCKNYDELRDENSQLPRLLVVVIVPERMEDWVVHSEESLVLRRCGYWISLVGAPESRSEKTERIRISCDKVWNIQEVQRVMQRIGNKEAL